MQPTAAEILAEAEDLLVKWREGKLKDDGCLEWLKVLLTNRDAPGERRARRVVYRPSRRH